MPSAYATGKAQAFASAPVKVFYESSVADSIVNRNYEGQVKGIGTIVNVLSFAKVTWGNYTGATLSPTALTEVAGQLVTNQQKSYYFQVKDIDTLTSWIKSPQGTVIEQLGGELKEIVDAYVLGFYDDVASGQRVGTDYTTGTVSIVTGTGAVTGVGTTFTSAMVGRGFKATGHTKWYRVKTFTSTTAIVVENDSDDEVSAYDGGTITGATYTIEAATALQVTSATIAAQIINLRTKLKKAKVPMMSAWLVLPSDIYALALQASVFTPYTPAAFEDVVRKGIVGNTFGFKTFESQQVAGDSVNGFRVLAGTTDWMTMAEALVEAEEEPFIAGNFGVGYKGLFVYGVKVVDERRKCAAEGYWKL